MCGGGGGVELWGSVGCGMWGVRGVQGCVFVCVGMCVAAAAGCDGVGDAKHWHWDASTCRWVLGSNDTPDMYTHPKKTPPTWNTTTYRHDFWQVLFINDGRNTGFLAVHKLKNTSNGPRSCVAYICICVLHGVEQKLQAHADELCKLLGGGSL